MSVQYSISDNGGRTCDRYTLAVFDSINGEWTIYGASERPSHPQGFGQYCGEMSGHKWRDFINRADEAHPNVRKLTADVRRFIAERVKAQRDAERGRATSPDHHRPSP